jgi:WD40 repeat protein
LILPEGNQEVLDVADMFGRRLKKLNEDALNEEYRYTISCEGAFSPDGTLFAAQFTKKHVQYVRLYDTSSWELLRTFRSGHWDNGGIAGIAISPDNKLLAVAQGNAFKTKAYIFSLEDL